MEDVARGHEGGADRHHVLVRVCVGRSAPLRGARCFQVGNARRGFTRASRSFDTSINGKIGKAVSAGRSSNGRGGRVVRVCSPSGISRSYTAFVLERVKVGAFVIP